MPLLSLVDIRDADRPGTWNPTTTATAMTASVTPWNANAKFMVSTIAISLDSDFRRLIAEGNLTGSTELSEQLLINNALRGNFKPQHG
jgi:hypothetical protein